MGEGASVPGGGDLIYPEQRPPCKNFYRKVPAPLSQIVSYCIKLSHAEAEVYFMRKPSLAERAPHLYRLSAQGVCWKCEGGYFQIAVYGDGTWVPICSNGTCRTPWEAIGKGPASIPVKSKTLD